MSANTYLERFRRITDDLKLDERPFSIFVNQIAAEPTTYGRYISAATAMTSTYESIRATMIRLDKLKRTLANPDANEQKRAIAAEYVPVEERQIARMAKRFSHLFVAAMHLLEQLPDIEDPKVRYELEAELLEANTYKRLMADLHMTGTASIAFWDLFRRLVRKDAKERIYEIARPPQRPNDMALAERRAIAMREWSRDDSVAQVAEELRSLPALTTAEMSEILAMKSIPRLPGCGEVESTPARKAAPC